VAADDGTTDMPAVEGRADEAADDDRADRPPTPTVITMAPTTAVRREIIEVSLPAAADEHTASAGRAKTG